MAIALALALQAVWMPQVDPATSRAAAAIFIEACLQGKLNLDGGRGTILPPGNAPDFAEVEWNVPATRTIVKFREPSDTYLVLAEYPDPPKKGFERSCVLVTRALNLDDAQRAFLVGSDGMKPVQTWWPNMYFPEWKIDARKAGYFKRMRLRDNRSILLEYSMYVDAPN